jgi:hypothetical protein
VGVDKYITLCPKSSSNHYIKSVSWVSVIFLEATGRLSRDVYSDSTRTDLDKPPITEHPASHNHRKKTDIVLYSFVYY